MKRVLKIVPLLLCAIIMFSVPALAAEKGNITVRFFRGEEPVAGADFEVRKAADWDGNTYRLVAPFASYSVPTPRDPDSDAWKALASTLAAYAARDDIPALATAATDEEGEAFFDNLADGLYLVTGAMVTLDDGTRLYPQPMLVTVPFTGNDGTPDYDVVTEPKYDEETGEKVSRNVIKIWKDSQNTLKRPAEITVQLLRDGEIYDEQTLNEENNWRYSWDNLDGNHTWQLTEKTVPEDYTVSVTREGITFTVENTNDNPPPPPPEIPQTGLLWWPVPVLAGLGAVALGVGIFLIVRRKNNA